MSTLIIYRGEGEIKIEKRETFKNNEQTVEIP